MFVWNARGGPKPDEVYQALDLGPGLAEVILDELVVESLGKKTCL
jgi:hypothetical protein